MFSKIRLRFCIGHCINFGIGGNRKSYGKILIPVKPISERMDII